MSIFRNASPAPAAGASYRSYPVGPLLGISGPIAPLATFVHLDTLPLLTVAKPDSGGQARRSALAPLGSDAAMQEATTRGIYDFHSMFYDATFGRLVKRRIARAINHMVIREGERVP